MNIKINTFICLSFLASSSLFAQVIHEFLPPREFSWEKISDKNTWDFFVRNWYADLPLNDPMVGEVRDSLLKKSELIGQYSKDIHRYQLPDLSVFCEYITLPRKNRAIALHIQNPLVSCYLDDTELGCGGAVSGFCWLEGEAALLLLDTERKKVLQKITALKTYGEDTLNIAAPLLSEAWGAYPCSRKKTEDNYDDWGLATLLYPRDMDGDGVAAEFLFYMYEACSVYNCSILSYDIEADSFFFPPFHLNVNRILKRYPVRKDSQYIETVNYILDFPMDAVQHGRIKFTKDVAHGSDVLFSYDLTYNRRRKRFEGTFREKPYSEQ